MSMQVPTKIDLTPRRHHGYAVLLFFIGTLLPPLAVAARFGIGGDFWLNVLLTLCGYIPGHGHNFYIQNIRNNKNHRRTPKWAQRYGLVDTSEIKRKARKSQWASRYNDRLPQSTLENAPYEEGQDHGSSIDNSSESSHGRRQANGDLWRPEDETYYGGAQVGESSSVRTTGSGRWHYPANFEDAVPTNGGSSKKSGKKKKDKKDRWARTEDAYSLSEEQTKRKKSKKKKKSKPSVGDLSVQTNDSTEFPEDAEGGLYGERRAGQSEEPQANGGATKVEDVFSHQF